MTGKDNNLTGPGLRQPFKSSPQPLIIIQDKAVVKNQRHLIAVALEQSGRGQTQSQVNLIHCAAGNLFYRNQASGSIHENIQIFIYAHTAVNPSGNAVDQLRGAFV